MPNIDEMRELLQQYLSTRRRIADIERKALRKLGTPAQGVLCSFCGTAESQVPLMVSGGDNTFICAVCIESFASILKGVNGQ